MKRFALAMLLCAATLTSIGCGKMWPGGRRAEEQKTAAAEAARSDAPAKAVEPAARAEQPAQAEAEKGPGFWEGVRNLLAVNAIIFWVLLFAAICGLSWNVEAYGAEGPPGWLVQAVCIAALVLLVAFNQPILIWIWNLGLLTLAAAVVIHIAGAVVWPVFIKWDLFLWSWKDIISDEIYSFNSKKKRTDASGLVETKIRKEDEQEFIQHLQRKKIPVKVPQPDDHYGRLVKWGLYWEISLIATVINELFRRLIKRLIRKGFSYMRMRSAAAAKRVGMDAIVAAVKTDENPYDEDEDDRRARFSPSGRR